MGSPKRRLLCLSSGGALILTLALIAPSLASARPHSTASAAPGGVGSYTTSTQTGQSIISGTADTGIHCDDCTGVVTLPFDVPVYGISYTSAVVSSNGNIQFTTDNPGYSNGCLPLPMIDAGRALFLYQDDLVTDGAGEGIFSATTGSDQVSR